MSYRNYPELKQAFQALHGWQQRYRELMLLGKSLPVLANELKVDEAKVSGCESNVWLYIDFTPQEDKLVVVADSDTRIVKGLLALILMMYNGKTPQQAAALDAEQEFEELGLMRHLSPSRGNGIRAIVSAIIQFAKSHC